MAADCQMSTAQWVQFFTASGLPSEVALRYAVVFSENRIQRGMLLDLTKEYLFDMGIHIMGDVIAILKHAKHVHSQEAQEKAISASSGSTKLVGIPSRYPRKTMVDAPQERHLPTARVKFQRSPPQQSSPGAVVRVDCSRWPPGGEHAAAVESARAAVRPLATKRRSMEEPGPPPKQRAPPPSWGAVNQRTAPVTSTPLQSEGPTLKVLLPSGTNPRTRQLLKKAQESQLSRPAGKTTSSTKRSVFDRLGESTVSSTTDLTTGKPVLGNSVFGRLGPSMEESVVDSVQWKSPITFNSTAPARTEPGRVIRLTAAPSLPRRSVLAPAVTRASIRGSPGTVMLQRSLTEANHSHATRQRVTQGTGGIALRGVRGRLGAEQQPRMVRTTAGPVRSVAGPVRSPVRATLGTGRTVARPVGTGSRALPALSSRRVVQSRTGIGRSTAPPQNVFSRLGGGASASVF